MYFKACRRCATIMGHRLQVQNKNQRHKSCIIEISTYKIRRLFTKASGLLLELPNFLLKRPSGRLLLQLRHVAEQATFFCAQLGRRPFLSNFTVRQHHDFVGIFNRTHAVSNHQNCLAGKQSGEGLLYLSLIFHVQ